MLSGFEDITAELTPDELALVPLFVKGFGDKLGEDRAITAAQITSKMKVPGPRVRKIVNYIRLKGMVRNLVATSKGYFIETDPSKIARYKQSLKARAQAINAVADSFEI